MIGTIAVIDMDAMIATIATAIGAATATTGTLIAIMIVTIGAAIVTAIGVTENATIAIETKFRPREAGSDGIVGARAAGMSS